MSIGTFLDSALFSVRCGLSNTIGDMEHIFDPVTPECVWERRRAKLEEATSFVTDKQDEESSQYEERDPRESLRRKLREDPLINEREIFYYEGQTVGKELETAKGELVVSVPDVDDSKTETPNPVENVDDILSKIAESANNENAKKELLERITKDVNL